MTMFTSQRENKIGLTEKLPQYQKPKSKHFDDKVLCPSEISLRLDIYLILIFTYKYQVHNMSW